MTTTHASSLFRSRPPEVDIRRPEYWTRQRPLIRHVGTTIASPDDLAATIRQDLPRLRRVARGYFLCEADCDDVVQEALMRAVRRLSQFQGRSSLGTWLHRIVVTGCLMRLRSESRRRDVTLAFAAEEIRESAPQSESELTRLREALAELPASYRTVIQMRYFERFSTAEAAQLLQVPVSVVKTRLHRAYRSLRSRLQSLQCRDS